MRRREFITLLGATVIGSRAVSAQTSPKDFHLGTVTPGMPLGENSPGGQILVRVLGERGYRLGQNLKFSSRGAMRQALTAQSSSGGYPMEPRRSGHDAAVRDVG